MGLSLSDLNPASLISNVAESVCDAVLPKNLEFVGDLVGLALDVDDGNWLKSVDDFQDFVKDLPQQLGNLTGPKAGPGPDDGLMTPTSLEPTPPSGYRASTDGRTTTTTTTTTTITPTTTTPAILGVDTARQRLSALPTSAPSPWDALQSPVSRPMSHATQAPTIATPVRGTPAGPESPALTSTQATAGMSANSFFGLSDDALLNAVRDGKLPDAVKNSPAEMQRLQMRMNAFTEMNQLITSMLKALHDMNTQVIQNLRV